MQLVLLKMLNNLNQSPMHIGLYNLNQNVLWTVHNIELKMLCSMNVKQRKNDQEKNYFLNRVL